MENKKITTKVGERVSYWFLLFELKENRGDISGSLKWGTYKLLKMDLETAIVILSSKINQSVGLCGYGDHKDLPKGFTGLPEFIIPKQHETLNN